MTEPPASPVPPAPSRRRASAIASAPLLIYLGLMGGARLVGFVRESLIAYFFGTSQHTDGYLAATALPELVAGVLLSGVFGYMIIPAVARLEQQGREADTRRLIGATFTHVTLWSTVFVVVTIALARPVMYVVAPGLHASERGEAITMLRVTSVAVVFFAAAGLVGGVLNTRMRFLAIPLSLVVANAAAIAALALLHRFGVVAAAISYVVSAVVTLAVQVVALARTGVRFPITLRVRSRELRRTMLQGGTAMLAVSTAFFRLLVERAMASTRRPGDLAALGFATKLILFAGALIAVPVGTMMFPRLSRDAASRDREAFISTVRRTAGLVLVGSIPLVLAFVFLSRPIVAVAFERGAFGVHGRDVTAGVLVAYGLGLSAICINEIIVRALFALGQLRFVAVSWTTVLVVNVALNFPLLHAYGVRGLGVGATIGVWLNVFFMTAWLARIIKRELPS